MKYCGPQKLTLPCDTLLDQQRMKEEDFAQTAREFISFAMVFELARVKLK